MTLKTDPPTDVGVIVGRFQVPELHEAHRELIEAIVKRHTKVLLFLGISRVQTTRTDPLDFEARKQMIEAEFPSVIVLGIQDKRSDYLWSKELDARIAEVITPGLSVTLYGSRDSFLKAYSGSHKTAEMESSSFVSGTMCRLLVSKVVRACKEFRAGIVWATHNRYPECIPTVDAAIINRDGRALMAKKPEEDKYRFVGGYAEPTSDSYEHDIKREIVEETGLEIGDLRYVSSRKINDWRYKAGTNKLKTCFFICSYCFGRPEAKDDIEELSWIPLKDLEEAIVVEEHAGLLQDLMCYLELHRSEFVD